MQGTSLLPVGHFLTDEPHPMRCRHCNRDMKIVAKQLCQTCYKNPAINSKYPKAKRGPHKQVCRERFGLRGEGLVSGKIPKEPTEAPPGSKAKAEVMRLRVERGETPNHPEDATEWAGPASDDLRAGD